MDPARLTSTGQPDFVVVTGLSGSGKSQAAKVLEDLGYYTLDNLPPALMASAIDVSRKGGKQKVAFVIDDVASTDPWRVRGVEIRGRAEALPDEPPLRPGFNSGIIRIHPRRMLRCQ